MSNGSPTAYLLWAILSCIYFIFYLMHLWNYDRFQCLRWDSGRQPGAFKRVMTYSLLGTLPLLAIFSVAITVLKFKEGFILAPDGEIIPRPFSLWNHANRRWLIPLYFVLSMAWSLEHVTHLEELTFWVFLLNQGPGKREWFASWEFRVWTIGSIAAITGMPLTVLSTRHNLETCLAYVFLVGSVASTMTTVFFFYVLARFPWFIRHVKSEGAGPDVVIRLATFYQLNRVRVIFRFLYTLPMMMIALDGISVSPYPIIGNPFAVDFLLMMSGIGCTISAAITLLIFFPRSITSESGYQTKIAPSRSPHSSTKTHPPPAAAAQYNNHTSSSATRRAVPSSKSTIPLPPPQVPEMRMGAFRFPADGDMYSLEFARSASSSSGSGRPPPPRVRRGSGSGSEGEGELSPGYETDVESEAPARAQISSDDTVWDRGHLRVHRDGVGYGYEERRVGGVPGGGGKRRRHSDGPFYFDARGQLVSPGAKGTGVAAGSLVGIDIGIDSGRGRRREREDEGLGGTEESALHPYVLHFTSPLDLHDGGRLSQSERGRARRPPTHV